MNRKGKSKVSGWFIFGAIFLLLILGLIVYGMFFKEPIPQTGLGTGTGQGQSNVNVGVNPAASWSTVDHWSSAALSGTDYVKVGASIDANGNVVGGSRYLTTAPGNVNPGTVYGYWKINTTNNYYVKPLMYTAGTLNNVIQNQEAYLCYTATLTGYDTINRQTTTSGAYNTSLAANGIANIEITYPGVSQKSNLPFGGILVVEMNASISTVTCTGQGITPGVGNFHITYTPASTGNKPIFFHIDDTFDTGKGQLVKKIECQFQNGGLAALANGAYYVKIIPANYYLGNDGNLYLDTEKNMNNADTTRTGLSTGPSTLTSYWG
jgi:hypothetical protein